MASRATVKQLGNPTSFALNSASVPGASRRGRAKLPRWLFEKASKRTAFIVGLPLWITMITMIIPQGFDYEGKNGMPTSSDMLNKIVWLYLLGFGVLMLVKHWARAKLMLRRVNPFVLVFLALAALSTYWSIESGVTVRRVIRASTMLMICLQFVLVAWHPKRFQNTLRGILTFVCVASIIFVFVDPEAAIHHSEQVELKDAWRGITMGKNILGSFASTAVVFWLHAWLAKETGRFKAACGILVAAVPLIMTHSATSIMATAFAVTFMLFLLRSPGSMKRVMPYAVSIFAILILIYSLAVLRLVPGMEIFLTPITLISGKDMTFTGRTAIWEILNEQIRLHPWLGGGYGAYWVGAVPTSPSYQMLLKLYFYPSEGHNGYLDVVNDLGIVGGIVLLGYFASYIRQSLQVLRFDRYQGGLFLTLLFRGFLANMSETNWFFVMSTDFLVMNLASFAMARALLQHHAQQQLAASGPPSQPTAVSNGQPRRMPDPMLGR